jgi:integrase
MAAAKIEEGRLLRPVSKSGKILRDELGDWAIWSVVEQSSKQIGIEHFGAHDLRRTCARLWNRSSFCLGIALGSEQENEIAVNDNLGLS